MGKTEQWFLDDHWLDQRLTTGPSLVMFDGLDEIFDRGDRDRVAREIAGFAQRYPRARIIVTSRPVGYREATLREAGFRHFGMQDLDLAQIEAFTRGWFALTFPQQPAQADQRIERVLGSVRNSPPIRLLAENPMLLTIMALLAREQELPRERAAFYEKAVEVLCHHWDANRNLSLPGVDYLNADDKKELLRRVAFRMQTGPGGLAGNFIHEDDLEDEISRWFVERFQRPPHDAIEAARTMIDTLRSRNYILCLRGPRLYGFVHRTFLEYLTAAEYVWRFNRAKSLTIEQLVALFEEHCQEEGWHEVLRLICGQIDEPFVGEIVGHLATRTDLDAWDGNTPLPELPLAIYCISEIRNPTRVEDAGRMLCRRIAMVSTKPGQGPEMLHYFRQELVPAVRELGPRWPGRDELERIALSHVDQIPEDSWADTFWPHFVAHVVANRDAVVALSAVTRGYDGGSWYRGTALKALADKWPDDQTRKLLETRGVEDDAGYTRGDALAALADKWPDDQTRNLLETHAVEDDDMSPRSAALQALADKWPDDQTRNLLGTRAVEDDNEYPRAVALQPLADKWPDDRTWTLLRTRAGDDPSKYVRDLACFLLGAPHSAFGRTVLTKRLDGARPYLDPLEPISREHIEKAARRAGIAPADVDVQVASLSAHLGWDITRGAKGPPDAGS